MNTISIGRVNCDIVIPDNCVSRQHATITLMDGRYVLRDTSSNGTYINGKKYNFEEVVVAPGTPIFLANKVQLSWPQILILLPPNQTPSSHSHSEPLGDSKTYVFPNVSPIKGESIGAGWGIVSFLFPIIGFILYFVWREDERRKARQAANIAWISILINFVMGFLWALAMY